MEQQTKVVFRVFPEGDVIALFPDEIADHSGNIMSYQQIGQHGAANIELIDDLRKATLEESEELKNELLRIGYDWREIDRK